VWRSMLTFCCIVDFSSVCDLDMPSIPQVDATSRLERRSGPETDDLIEMIEALAANLADDLGAKWHEHAYPLAAFKAGLLALLAQYKPEGDAGVRPRAGDFGELNDPPDVVGRLHAKWIWDLMCDAKAEQV